MRRTSQIPEVSSLLRGYSRDNLHCPAGGPTGPLGFLKGGIGLKYVIEFISKIEDAPSRNALLTFGETDIKSIAELCFEYGSRGYFSGVRVKRVKKEK